MPQAYTVSEVVELVSTKVLDIAYLLSEVNIATGCQSIEEPSGLELVMLSCNAYASSRIFYTLSIKGINTGSLYID